MNDELHQLLRRADRGAPAPTVDVTALPERIRLRARHRKQWRMAARGLVLILVVAIIPALISRRSRILGNQASIRPDASAPKATPMAPADPTQLANLDIRLHERTAFLLQISEDRRLLNDDKTDAFLDELQMQRNRTALVLLQNANRRLADDEAESGATDLRRMVQLFPDTPAAALATRQLKELNLPERQL